MEQLQQQKLLQQRQQQLWRQEEAARLDEARRQDLLLHDHERTFRTVIPFINAGSSMRRSASAPLQSTRADMEDVGEEDCCFEANSDDDEVIEDELSLILTELPGHARTHATSPPLPPFLHAPLTARSQGDPEDGALWGYAS